MIKNSQIEHNSCKEVLNIKNTASLLRVSEATIRNWFRCGYLPSFIGKEGTFFYKRDVEAFNLKLQSGELNKLKKRANKSKADTTFIPEEYITDPINLNRFNSIIEFIHMNNINKNTALLLLSLNLLKKEKVLPTLSINDVVNKKLFFSNKQIQKEIAWWLKKIKFREIQTHFSFLLNCDLPEQRDVLGTLYQSLLYEGKKSQAGSYYTPSSIVSQIVKDYTNRDSKVLDPCCGTGQFLLAFSDIIKNPMNIYGIDCDKIAVRIARLNLLIRFRDEKFVPNIFCKDALLDFKKVNSLFFHDDKSRNKFHVIATNPPWGGHFSREEIQKLKTVYPQITSSESFSYFLERSLQWVCDSGIISFILPESILNVRTHKDIRKIILKHSQIKKIVCLKRIFKSVFTPVIRLDIQKTNRKSNGIVISNKDKKHIIYQSQWMGNKDFVFNINVRSFDHKILDKVYQRPHITLKNKSSWALGIVTGNNNEFIKSKRASGFEPVYTGKEVKRFILSEPSKYIHFQPQKFQQVAGIEKYRAKEKLVYKFISKNLVFAYDNRQRLTLNSANILIPEIPDYSFKVVAALFNSTLYQFIFQKKFSSIKILRSHIEDLPLPLWDKAAFSKIIVLVSEAIKGTSDFQILDNYIMNKFSFSQREKKYINTFKN